MKNETHEDRRVRKTKRSLRDCLIRLMKEKKIQDITVREISEMADINRGTFYLHYKDIYDLLEHVESDFAGEFDSSTLRTRSSPSSRNVPWAAGWNSTIRRIWKSLAPSSPTSSPAAPALSSTGSAPISMKRRKKWRSSPKPSSPGVSTSSRCPPRRKMGWRC